MKRTYDYIRSRLGMMRRGEFDWGSLATRCAPWAAIAAPLALTLGFWGFGGFIPFVLGIVWFIAAAVACDRLVG